MPEWQKAATEYEQRLGAHLAERPEVRTAAQLALRRLHDVLTRDYILQNSATSEADARKITAEAFFLDEAKSAGQIGTGTIHYLTTNDRVTVREVMTAFFNAAYFRSETEKTKPGFKDISLKATVQRIYFDSPSPTTDARKLGLNDAYLAPYTDFLTRNEPLAALRKLLPAGRARNLGRDVFACGCLAYYSRSHFKEYVQSQMARNWEDPDGKYSFPADYARLGGSTGLSQAECDYLGRRPVFPDLEGFDCSFTPGASPLSPDEIAARKSKSGVIDVQEHYDYASGNRAYKGYVTVKAQKVKPLNVRSGDLDPAAYGPEFPLNWSEGWKSFYVKAGSDWHQKYSIQRGYPLIAGLSGTAARIFSAYGWLQVPAVRALDFAKALLAWMLPTRDHSLYEIIKAIHIATLNTKSQNETTAVARNPRTLRKKRLLSNPSDNADLDQLAIALKLGAHYFYNDGAKILTEESGHQILPGEGQPSLPPDPERIYTDKIQTAGSIFLQSGMSDLFVIRAISKYIPTIKDYNAPPDVADAKMTRAEERWFGRYDRKSAALDWLEELQCTGVELSKEFRTAHIAAVYTYTGAGYELINRIDRKAKGGEVGGVRRGKLIAEALWYLCDRKLSAHVTGEWGGETPPAVPNIQELSAHWDAATDAASDLASAVPGRAADDARKRLVSEKNALKSSIMAYCWSDVDQELKAHTDFAFMGITALPPLPGSSLSLYRGTWELRGPVGVNPDLKSRFVTRKLTSTSTSESAAVRFARHYESDAVRKPAVVQLTKFTSAAAKACYGYVAGVSKQPHEAEAIITKGVSFKRFAKSDREVGSPKFLATYLVYEWESGAR
ncbi:hypothetical protein [Streptomyces syringium]|uniref:hypothetical protein n=1 Tax=Streptomyces syringium TaxID=76729 RepID=UPI0034527D38